MGTKMRTLLAALALPLLLAACGTRDEQQTAPPSEPEESGFSSQPSQPSEPPEPEPQPDPENPAGDEAFYREVLLNFGGELAEDEDGRSYIRPAAVSLYYGEDWTGAETVEPGAYYSWFLSWMWRSDLTYEEMVERYASPYGEDMGWFFPQDEYESTVRQFFDVSVEHLRSDEIYYDAEYEGYTLSAGGGRGEQPEVVLDRVESDGDLRNLSVSLLYEYSPQESRVLTIRVLDDGTYRYTSFLTQE